MTGREAKAAAGSNEMVLEETPEQQQFEGAEEERATLAVPKSSNDETPLWSRASIMTGV